MSRIPPPGRGVHPDGMFDDDPQLAAFARDLREAAATTAPPAVGATLAAVLEGREAPPVASIPPAPARPGRSRLRWVVGGAVFGLGIGSLGVAGALPDPVQRQVAHLGDVVGVHLPEPAQDTPASSVVPDVVPASTVPPARASHTTSTTDDDGTEAPGGNDDHGSNPAEDRKDDEGPGRSGEEHGTEPPTTTVDDDHGGARDEGADRGPEGSDDEVESPAARKGPSTTTTDVRATTRARGSASDADASD